jgi:hypothetical protein
VARDDQDTPEPAAVDEGSITAWATFGAAMAEATDALQRTDHARLLGALEELTEATRSLTAVLRQDDG